MLFIQSNSLAQGLGGPSRLRLLDALAARGLSPLVRTLRRRCFESLAAGRVDAGAVASAADEFERECALLHEADSQTAYTPGELFCAEDCVLSLLFRDVAEEDGGAVVAAIVYSVETAEPLRKLERFCRDVREALAEIGEGAAGRTEAETEEETTPVPEWRARDARLARQGLARFIAAQPAELVRAAALRGGRELARASELMAEPSVRGFLRRVEAMRHEGFTPRRLFGEAGALGAISIETLLDAGLLDREVRVSCRKSGHALFDLPTPDSLAAVTISRAKCSLCAAPVADEVIEETINPTRLAVSLLEDGRWLTNRVYKLIRSLGIPDSEIATGPAAPGGESHLAVEVCGSSFLFVTRDGDLTPALTRRLAGVVEETEAAHLVVVVTGAVEDEGQMRLYEFAWRRARAGRDLDVTLVEGLTNARALFERSFERAVRRHLSRQLCHLDPALGFAAANFVLGWFKSLHASRTREQQQPRALPRRSASRASGGR